MIATTLDICGDCLQLLANGEYDPELSEEECAEYAARVETGWPSGQWEITLGVLESECNYCPNPDTGEECESTGFTWSSCDLCGSSGPRQGGGDRYHATAWPITPEASGYTYERLVHMVGGLQSNLAVTEDRLESMADELEAAQDELADLTNRLEQYEPPTAATLAAYMVTGKVR